MSRLLVRPASESAHRGVLLVAILTRASDRAVDATVGFLASWTMVYHVCLVTRLGAWTAVILEVVVLLCWAWVWSRRRVRSGGSAGDVRPDQDARLSVPDASLPSSRAERALVTVTLASATGSALLFAFDGSWPVTVVLWLTAAVAGAGWAGLRLHRRRGSSYEPGVGEHARASAGHTYVAMATAMAMAVLSTITLRPNPDDLYYVNLSQWVVEHGSFPLRDTIFSDLAFPMASWPPTASYDPLVGTVARLIGVDAGTVVYLFVPPLVAILSVLALWRLLRVWRLRAVSMALVLAVTFLVFDGAPGYATPGNLFVTRLWQGKVILLCLMVPVLLTYALTYVEKRRRRSLVWLFLAGTAAVGLSTTAMFLVPLLAAAAMAPLAVRGYVRDALLGFATLAAYPIAAGVVTIAVNGHSADDFGSRDLYRFDPAWFGHEIYLDGAIAFVAVASVLVGALLVPHRDARVTTALLVLVTGITFIPEVTDISYDLVGLGPTLWRVSWLATTAALVGVAGTALSQRGVAAPTVLKYLVPIALAAIIVVAGTPIWSAEAGVSFKKPWEWQRSAPSLAAAKQVIAAADDGDVVLAPQDLAITLDVMTTRVKTVAPRDYFMDYLRDEPGFDFDDRLTLVEFVNLPPGDPFDEAGVRLALDRLQIDSICLPTGSEQRVMFLEGTGYIPGVATASYGCLDRLAS